MDIKIKFVIIIIVIILLLILLLLELKRVEYKKDEKKPENDKREKVLLEDKSYSDLKKFITELFSGFENRIIGLLKEMKTLNDQEVKNPDTPSFQNNEDVQISSETDPLSSCILLYNKAVENSDKQGEFHKKFRPLRADLKNDQERRSNPSLEPEFKTSDSGRYFVVEMRHSGSSDFAVFPMFELTISDNNYKIGAWGEVFKCLGYKEGCPSRVAQVKSPAFFYKSKDKWTLAAKGELYLAKKMNLI